MRRDTLKPLITALFLFSAGCLGGTGGDDDGGDDTNDQPAKRCATALEEAPSDSIGSFDDMLPLATSNTWDLASIPSDNQADYPGGKYRTLTPDSGGNIHPGCSTAGLSYAPANIPGYPCAAKEYPFPSGVSEDATKPIVLLVHGNSDTPASWEPFVLDNPASIEDFVADTEARPQLANKLPELGYRTIAVDMRMDLNDDPPNAEGGNPSRNFDHGWGVPITQEFIKRVVQANPGRRISLIGLSLGSTIIRDALRRLWVEHQRGDWDINVFSVIDDVILGSGGHHGVSTYGSPGYCGQNFTMRGLAACQFGQRNTYSQVPFHQPLNGPPVPEVMTRAGEWGGWWETPCADASYAFGKRDACGGNAVSYTTITMSDLPDGTQQDLFVSEHASRLYPEDCAENHNTTLNDFDTSGYLANGLLRNHYGSTRSNAGHNKIIAVLGD